MNTQAKTGGAAFGGDHKSAIDALSGLVVVPDKSGAAATAHPLTAPPVAKNYKPVQAVPGQRSRTTDACGPGSVQGGVSANHEAGKGRYADHVALGRAIIGEALASAPCDHPAKLGSKS